jgi:hypothetical protein
MSDEGDADLPCLQTRPLSSPLSSLATGALGSQSSFLRRLSADIDVVLKWY